MEILETVNEKEFKTFVSEFWKEKHTGDWDKSLNSGMTFSQFKCYKMLVPETQALIDSIGKTPAEFISILKEFIVNFILANTSVCKREDFEFVGLPDLIDDYYKVKE